MIKVKHLLEAVDADDGARLWVEPIGLTRDLREWCRVDAVLAQLGPPQDLWTWFSDRPGDEAYDYFRGVYHAHLANGPHRRTLETLAHHGVFADITLLHQGEDPQHNTAVALHEFLSELQSYCPPQV